MNNEEESKRLITIRLQLSSQKEKIIEKKAYSKKSSNIVETPIKTINSKKSSSEQSKKISIEDASRLYDRLTSAKKATQEKYNFERQNPQDFTTGRKLFHPVINKTPKAHQPNGTVY